MSSIISYLLHIIQYQNQQIRFLVLFISKYIPLAQWAHDDTHSPKYQKFKTDKLPVIQPFFKQDWQFLLAYYEHKYQKKIKPVQRRNGSNVPKTLYVQYATLRIIIFMTITEITGNTNVKSVQLHLLAEKISPKP